MTDQRNPNLSWTERIERGIVNFLLPNGACGNDGNGENASYGQRAGPRPCHEVHPEIPREIPRNRLQDARDERRPRGRQVCKAETICTICAENLQENQMASVGMRSCGHMFCSTCLNTLFEHAIESETSWPPRCCRVAIPASSVESVLPAKVIERFNVKSLEWGTQDRTYCHDQTCSAFIPPATVRGRRAACPRCNRATCARCKSAYHVQGWTACIRQNDRLLEATARQEGWQRCPQCQRLIEHASG